MPAYWLGPFEQKFNVWGEEKEVTEQRYEFYLGSLVMVGYLRGRGGLYSGNLTLPGGNDVNVAREQLQVAQGRFQMGLAVWLANAGLTFDEDILSVIPQLEKLVVGKE